VKYLALALLVACGSSKDAPPQAKPDKLHLDPEGNPVPMDAPKQAFALTEDGISDDPKWRQAATVVASAFTASLNKLEVTKVRVYPLASPSGETAPYLLGIEAHKDDQLKFKGYSLVGGGLVINGGGTKRLEAHLADIGFPKTKKVPLGHLVEMVHLSGVAKKWTKSPALLGWE
jgi:hypothetical protein